MRSGYDFFEPKFFKLADQPKRIQWCLLRHRQYRESGGNENPLEQQTDNPELL
jgi:hypothetical protein